MKQESLTFIEATQTHLPETRLSSDAIEDKLLPVYQRLKLPSGRLELMTGIKERRIWDNASRPSDHASESALKLLQEKNIDPKSIDLLIFASVCRDGLEPASASYVHSRLKLRDNCPFFDLSNACLGLLHAVSVAREFIDAGVYKKVLVVGGESSGPVIHNTIERLNNDLSLNRKDIKKYIANLTLGSGACSLLISHGDQINNMNTALKINHINTLTNSSTAHLCQGSGSSDQLMMETHSEELLHAGIDLAKRNWDQFSSQQDPSDLNFVLTHQVGEAHERLLFENLNLAKYKTFHTYPYLGNTGSVALPITLDQLMVQNIEQNLKKGDKVALLGIGSGLSSLFMGIEW
jgi:acyl-CoA:acyl-CoA alkyltransferase